MLMLTTDTDTVVDTTAVDTTDTDVLTDTTEAKGPLKLKPHPRLMLTTDTVDTMAVDTDIVDTDTVDTVDTIMVELLLKQTNPLNYNCQDQVTRNSFNLATMQKLPPPLFFFLKHENSLFFPIELESKSNVYNLKSL